MTPGVILPQGIVVIKGMRGKALGSNNGY